jgi:hypothetical protein
MEGSGYSWCSMKVDSSFGWLRAPDPESRGRVSVALDRDLPSLDWSLGSLSAPASLFALEAAIVARYVSSPRPAFSRLPFDYRLVPPLIRSAGLAFLERLHSGSAAGAFPAWPLETQLDDLRGNLWAKAAAAVGVELEPPAYPGGRQAAVILTHDIDSRADIAGIDDLRTLERNSGMVSSFGFIPKVSWPAKEVLDRLAADGCEVYCHDIGHDGKLPYISLGAVRTAFERFFAPDGRRDLVRGFRSGQLLMSPELLQVLGEFFDYDMSLPDTERGGPYGSTAGCATVYPFTIDGLLELPLTMPQDFYLANVERYDAEAMLRLWRDKLDAIVARGGVVVVNTHPIWTNPGRTACWTAYQLLLQAIAESDVWVTTPSAMRKWLFDRRGRPSQ